MGSDVEGGEGGVHERGSVVVKGEGGDIGEVRRLGLDVIVKERIRVGRVRVLRGRVPWMIEEGGLVEEESMEERVGGGGGRP